MYSVVKKNLDLLLTIFHLGSSLPESRQLGKDQNICMWVINIISLKEGYVCGSLLLSHLFSETPMPAPCLVSKVRPVEAKEVAKEEELAKLADQNRPNPFSQILFWCFFQISKT